MWRANSGRRGLGPLGPASGRFAPAAPPPTGCPRGGAGTMAARLWLKKNKLSGAPGFPGFPKFQGFPDLPGFWGPRAFRGGARGPAGGQIFFAGLEKSQKNPVNIDCRSKNNLYIVVLSRPISWRFCWHFIVGAEPEEMRAGARRPSPCSFQDDRKYILLSPRGRPPIRVRGCRRPAKKLSAAFRAGVRRSRRS